MYTLFLVSFSLFQAAILHHVVLFLLLQHNSWNFLCFYANSKGHAFKSDFHLTYRSNITDAGFSGLGQRYVARTQYKQFISGRGYVKWDIQHTDLLCCHIHYFLKQLLTNELMFVRLQRRREGRAELLSDKIQQISQNAANGSCLVAICNSFTSDC